MIKNTNHIFTVMLCILVGKGGHMFYKELLNIFHNRIACEIIENAKNIVMIVLIIIAILMMEGKEIDFIYANF